MPMLMASVEVLRGCPPGYNALGQNEIGSLSAITSSSSFSAGITHRAMLLCFECPC